MCLCLKVFQHKKKPTSTKNIITKLLKKIKQKYKKNNDEEGDACDKMHDILRIRYFLSTKGLEKKVIFDRCSIQLRYEKFGTVT